MLSVRPSFALTPRSVFGGSVAKRARAIVIAACVGVGCLGAGDVATPNQPGSIPVTIQPETGVNVRIDGKVYRMTTEVVRDFPGIIPDTSIVNIPGIIDSLVVTFTPLSSRRQPTFRAVTVDLTVNGTRSTHTLTTSGTSESGVRQYSVVLQSREPSIAYFDRGNPTISARVSVRTSRGTRAYHAGAVPFRVIMRP